MKHTEKIMESNSFPLDLIIEIFKRLSLKTLIKFLCLSKFWASTIRSRDFMKLFLNESLTKPKSLVYVFRTIHIGSALSSVHFRSIREATSSSASSSFFSASSPTYHVTFHTRQRTTITPSVHGLICYGPASRLMIYNPCTRRSINLPKINAGRRSINHYISYDPIDNDYKVLCIMRGKPNMCNKRSLAEEIWVLTLGSIGDSWRMIQDAIPPHFPESKELCINGVLYYQAFAGAKLNDSAIMSFDVMSEKLKLIEGPCTFPKFSKLTTYEGKLAVIFFENRVHRIIGLWVLEDVSKVQWFKKTFGLPYYLDFIRFQVFHTTDPDTGELILTPVNQNAASVSNVLYFDLRENDVRFF